MSSVSEHSRGERHALPRARRALRVLARELAAGLRGPPQHVLDGGISEKGARSPPRRPLPLRHHKGRRENGFVHMLRARGLH